MGQFWEMKNAYKIFVGKPWHRWKYNIKMDLIGLKCEDLDLSELTKDRIQWQEVVNQVMNFRVP
jgi:hypothetical protein